LPNRVPFLDVPGARTKLALFPGVRCRSQKIANGTLYGVCKTRAQPLTLARRPFSLKWPRLGSGLASEKQMPRMVTPVQVMSWIAATSRSGVTFTQQLRTNSRRGSQSLWHKGLVSCRRFFLLDGQRDFEVPISRRYFIFTRWAIQPISPLYLKISAPTVARKLSLCCAPIECMAGRLVQFW
jgi:hypothetical protein